MKKTMRFTLLLLCLVLLLQVMPVASQASSEVPYQTYTQDKWGNAIPCPNGYLPTRSIGGAQLGCGNFNNAADMFYSKARHEVYIVDSGNARIVVLSEDMTYLREYAGLDDGGEGYSFANPQGIFVLDDGTMYIADMGNQQVVVASREGKLLSILPTPESNLLPNNFNYLPTKVVVDEKGRAYILSQGVYQGFIYLDTDGSFIKFFGANEVEMTLRRQMMKLWKSILSDKAASTMQSFNPIEYGNAFMGSDGYIYATAAGTENNGTSVKLLTKLNPLGIDCIPFRSSGNMLFSDITVDENKTMTVLDSRNGMIYQVAETQQTFSFGGIGDQVGLFRRPVSIIEVNENLYVLDADKNTITEFELTEFGRLVREATALYDAGLYVESIEPWLGVARHDANFLLAYTGLGKAYYQLKDYDTAMYYFRLAGSRANYSLAFREASLNRMRSSFAYIVLGIVALIVVILVLRRIWWRIDFSSLIRCKKASERGKEEQHE